MDTILGWHFTGATLRDGRPLPPIGEWLRHDGAIVPCDSGLHMSVHPFDALRYAPGPILHRVELRGEIVSHGEPIDKYVGRERLILASIDATTLLRRFAADQALSVSHLWVMPAVVREYLSTLDESSRAAAWAAAWYASRAAARAAARDAARAAARDAARDAAWDASWAASWDASWAASRAAARAEARDEARAEARDDFSRRVYEAFGIND